MLIKAQAEQQEIEIFCPVEQGFLICVNYYQSTDFFNARWSILVHTGLKKIAVRDIYITTPMLLNLTLIGCPPVKEQSGSIEKNNFYFPAPLSQLGNQYTIIMYTPDKGTKDLSFTFLPEYKLAVTFITIPSQN